MGRSCSAHVRMRNAYKCLDRRPERMRPLGRYLCKWILNILFWGGLDWDCLCEDAKS
jgi:hypothetical protein